MLGAKLARRIVVPLLVAIAALFAILGFVAVRNADARVAGELEDEADRIAAALDGFPPEHRVPAILDALSALSGVEVLVAPPGPRPGHRVLERSLRRGRCFIVVAEERLTRRRRDVLFPVAVAGAAGLLVALLLGLFVTRMIARPVAGLAHSVRAFGRGDSVDFAAERGPGEIGELQDAFARMATDIRVYEDKIKESERFAALGRLAGGIAHELRNPLTAIRMAVELEGADARRVALAEIDRLDRTLRELLDFVRPREPRLTDVAIDDLFHDVVSLLKPQCEHLRVTLAHEGGGGLVVTADYDRLKQSLINLVLNGAQAQPNGGTVRLRVHEGGIEVRDAGPGIPDEVRETLWQPFVTTKEAGIGLGLAVVAQVAEEHGAQLDFRTGPGGTTFRLVF